MLSSSNQRGGTENSSSRFCLLTIYYFLKRSRNTIRKSVAESEFIVQWVEGAPYMPSSIEAVPEAKRSAVLSHAQAKEEMKKPEWTPEIPE